MSVCKETGNTGGDRWTGQWNDWRCKAGHPTADLRPMTNNPADLAANDPAGVPVSAIIFGGRRRKMFRLVSRRITGCMRFLGATQQRNHRPGFGQVVLSPRSMHAPFHWLQIRDYLVHWFRMRKRMSDCPRIFHVNWFRTDENGKFMWPGFGETCAF